MNQKLDLGIIGGSGLYGMEALTGVSRKALETPFGSPSDEYVLGNIEGKRVAFLPRHGRNHNISPSELNFRANIYGFKMLGAERILSVTAVGSLREEIRPLQMVVPDQFFDRTLKRDDTFFTGGLVAHVSLADPVCPELARVVHGCAIEAGVETHQGGTLVTMEGPAFSTKAESNVYRQWGMDIVGMTSFQEAKLAREAEICYTALALVTDYDCWKEEEEKVTVEAVVQNLRKNIANAKNIIGRVARNLPQEQKCSCRSALKNAIMTDLKTVSPEAREKFSLLAGKYL